VFTLLLWMIFGTIVGAAARWIVPGAAAGGVLGDLIVGILGAVAGGWLYGLFGHAGISGPISLAGAVCAFIGAVLLLWTVRSWAARKA